MKSAADVAAKWSRNLSSAGQSIRDGVQRVTVNPAATAAQRIPAYLAGVQNAVNSGKMARGLGRVTLQSWQQAMIDKGLPRIASGASSAQPKMATFMAAWLPYQEQLKSKLAATPRGDLQANIQRMITAVQHNAAFVYNPS